MIDQHSMIKQYVGRFAPSPTGSLHLGSLLTAVASYCDAMHNKGQWLVRIEDIDPLREIKGASLTIINRLLEYGFNFNQDIVFQSQLNRQLAYEKSVKHLEELGVIYYCYCSRVQLKSISAKNHSCRLKLERKSKPHSLKIKTPDISLSFKDKIQGAINKSLFYDCGDFVIKRKDGLFAYQLAVVVDDFHQGITDIVRGIDLISSTPWQIYLNSLLGYNQPNYCHVPILVNNEGQKLSKQSYAKEITNENPIESLIHVYKYLNQTPFLKKPKSLKCFWQHAIQHWNINKIRKTDSIEV